MLNQPMSSPQMMRMFGFFVGHGCFLFSWLALRCCRDRNDTCFPSRTDGAGRMPMTTRVVAFKPNAAYVGDWTTAGRRHQTALDDSEIHFEVGVEHGTVPAHGKGDAQVAHRRAVQVEQFRVPADHLVLPREDVDAERARRTACRSCRRSWSRTDRAAPSWAPPSPTPAAGSPCP